MHRCALPRLSSNVSASILHTLRRCKSSTSRPAVFRDKGPSNSKVAEDLRKVLSPEAVALLSGLKKGKKVALGSLPSSKEVVDSMEKMKFEAFQTPPEPVFLFDSADADISVGRDQRFPAGTLVEIRRNSVRAMAVVLYTILLDGVWLVHSLTSDGDVWVHNEHDVQFQIPDFVSRKLAERCGLDQKVETEEEMSARVEVCERLRDFDKRLEYDLHLVYDKALAIDFYRQVSHEDAWMDLTLKEAAKKLLEGRSHITPSESLAVQMYLFDYGPHFIVESRRFMQTQMFHVRPRSEVAVIDAVRRMCLTHDPAIDAFAEKTRALVLDYRKRAVESKNEPPSRHPLTGVELTEADKTILRFLIGSLPAVRSSQVDYFAASVAHILKKVGLYQGDEYGDYMLYDFLTEMGIFAPWEEVITHDPTRPQRVEGEPLPSTPATSTPLAPKTLGPDDLYPSDVVESLRHDFGNMQAYVVDDWDAEELDDGVSIERDPSNPDYTWLHVHIADPTVLLPPTHRIARDAARMVESRYLLDRTIPMLPRDIFHRFSLGSEPGQPDKVLTFSAKVSPSGDIVDYKVRPAIVRNVRQVKYDEADALLGAAPVKTKTTPYQQEPPSIRKPVDASAFEPRVKDDFLLLYQTARKLLQSRLRAGAVAITRPAAELQLNPRPFPEELLGGGALEPFVYRGFPQISYSVMNTNEVGARFVVSEGMKTAGRVASLFFRDRGIPALRRSVGPMRSEYVTGVEEVLRARDDDGVVDYLKAIEHRVSAPTACYLTTPAPHSLLGISADEGYVKVTSPLRRFGDTFAHWQIKQALLAEAGEITSPILFPEDWLTEMIKELERREMEVKVSGKLQIQFWAHMFLRRWQADSAAAQREHDPLQKLVAEMVTMPVRNHKKNLTVCKVYLRNIGLMAYLDADPDRGDVGLGDVLTVKVQEIKLGMRPMLTVVPA
ncbi:hypothetical protein BN946_scf184945.g63 [Trametes cinnabarina]|uniref:RNB domain-containing protein n=1 Tax=Pycnoporus cinnabarinus TaxID=5643 RepID=A0A060SLD3_PYCCI|nr:hypothetical protein BN946_scf184945.g63 [Trametes cinnabarina]